MNEMQRRILSQSFSEGVVAVRSASTRETAPNEGKYMNDDDDDE